MKSSNIYAHRGLWKNTEDQNSLDSLLSAINSGFSVETDVRDLNGDLVVSHDPPGKNYILLRELLTELMFLKLDSTLAINIKSDGLQKQIMDLTSKFSLSSCNFFVFDASVPELFKYQQAKIPIYTRISDLELSPLFIENASGIWLDSFYGGINQIDMVKDLIDVHGISVCLVSPELHKRSHKPIWDRIKELNIYSNKLFQICTDFPLEAREFFND